MTSHFTTPTINCCYSLVWLAPFHALLVYQCRPGPALIPVVCVVMKQISNSNSTAVKKSSFPCIFCRYEQLAKCWLYKMPGTVCLCVDYYTVTLADRRTKKRNARSKCAQEKLQICSICLRLTPVYAAVVISRNYTFHHTETNGKWNYNLHVSTQKQFPSKSSRKLTQVKKCLQKLHSLLKSVLFLSARPIKSILISQPSCSSEFHWVSQPEHTTVH